MTLSAGALIQWPVRRTPLSILPMPAPCWHTSAKPRQIFCSHILIILLILRWQAHSKNIHAMIEGTLSRLIGEREFWSLSFALNEDTADPRPDSETLVEEFLHMLTKMLLSESSTWGLAPDAY